MNLDDKTRKMIVRSLASSMDFEAKLHIRGLLECGDVGELIGILQEVCGTQNKSKRKDNKKQGLDR